MSVRSRGAASTRAAAPAAWAPLRHPAFRTAWLTFLGVQVVNWAETVGAVDVIAAQSGSAALLALVQTASSLPVVALAMPAGAAADLVDRRRLLIGVVAAMGTAMALLGALAAADAATPVVVLLLTLVVGGGLAVAFPAFSAMIPDLVPRAELAQGVTLLGISINLARATGPAIAGVALLVVGPPTLFAGLAVALAVMAALLLTSPRAAAVPPARGTGVVAAMREGVRFAWTAPGFRSVLARAGCFVVPANALWAVLPAVTVQRLGLDASAFGGMLAALGVGAVAGAQVLPALRARLGLDVLLRCGTVYGVVNLAVLALVDSTPVVVASLVVAGAAWIAVLSSLNTAAQLAAPDRVRGRALALNQAVLSGGMASGALLWGVVAELAGLQTSLLVAAGVLLATLACARRWPLDRGVL